MNLFNIRTYMKIAVSNIMMFEFQLIKLYLRKSYYDYEKMAFMGSAFNVRRFGKNGGLKNMARDIWHSVTFLKRDVDEYSKSNCFFKTIFVLHLFIWQILLFQAMCS